MEKKNKFRDYRMVGLSVKAVVSAVPVAAVYVMAYLFLSSLSGAVTGLLLEKLTEYYGTAEPPVRCGESHLSGLTEPLHFVY